MTKKKTPAASSETVHLWPTGLAHIPGVPTEELDVDPATAAELLAYSPAVFTTDPAAAASGPVRLYVEQPDAGLAPPPDQSPPAEPAEPPTEAPPDAGPSDSTSEVLP
jgi:hypothetical protein